LGNKNTLLNVFLWVKVGQAVQFTEIVFLHECNQHIIDK